MNGDGDGDGDMAMAMARVRARAEAEVSSLDSEAEEVAAQQACKSSVTAHRRTRKWGCRCLAFDKARRRCFYTSLGNKTCILQSRG